MVGVGARRACQRDDEDGPKHVHESCEAPVCNEVDTSHKFQDAEGIVTARHTYLFVDGYTSALQALQANHAAKGVK